MTDLRDQVVVVTGASSGIGLAVALQASEQGAHVVLVARGERALDDAATRCRAAGAASVGVSPLDVGDDKAVGDLVESVLAEHGRLDVVINSAGVVAYGRTEEVPPEVFDGVIRTNLLGSVNVARHVVPVLRRQERGALLLVGSVLGHVTVPTMAPYVVSKWGVRALARQLRTENSDLPDVRIAYVAPGGVDTPIYDVAANYVGVDGMAPPPVASPERTARQVLARATGRSSRTQLTVANDLIRLGFSLVPPVYDALVSPLFSILAADQQSPRQPGPGNVLSPREDDYALTGHRQDRMSRIVSNVTRRIR